jgi:hypothetical protein
LQIRFQTPKQYLFYHQNVKHLLLIWAKEHTKQLFIVEDEKDQTLSLSYPGETYAEMVLDQVSPIFFQELQTETETFTAILGATFSFRGKLIGMYYHPDQPATLVYFFQIQGEKIEEIPEAEYADVVEAFLQEFPEYVENP